MNEPTANDFQPETCPLPAGAAEYIDGRVNAALRERDEAQKKTKLLEIELESARAERDRLTGELEQGAALAKAINEQCEKVQLECTELEKQLGEARAAAVAPPPAAPQPLGIAPMAARVLERLAQHLSKTSPPIPEPLLRLETEAHLDELMTFVCGAQWALDQEEAPKHTKLTQLIVECSNVKQAFVNIRRGAQP